MTTTGCLGERVCHTETNRRRGAHPADDIEVVGAIRDCEEFAAGLASRSNDRFVAGESIENKLNCSGPRELLTLLC